MQIKLAALLLFSSLSAGAQVDPCREGTLFHELSRLNGTNEVGHCQLEVHVCEKKNKQNLPFYLEHSLQENSGFWMGDILVKHKNGASLYVPLYAPESRFPNTWITASENDSNYFYYYKDKNFDPVSGLREMYQVTVSKRRTRLDFMMKSSRESRKRPIRSLFFPNIKIVCEKLK